MTLEIQISKKNGLFAPQQLGDLSVEYKDRNFYVITSKEKKILVQKLDLDATLKEIDPNTLQKMLDVGYLHLSQRGNDYALTYKCRGLGGGPLAGSIAYWGTKILCYGTAAAGAGAAVITTGGAALGAATGAAAAGTTVAAGTGASAIVTGGSSVVVGAIAGAGGTAAAAEVTAGAIAGAGGIAGAAAAVESGAMAAGAFFTAIPFLP